MHDSNSVLKKHKNENGSSIIIAMIILLAFAALVLAGSQCLIGEQRISANQNDKQFAFQLAELALKDGEDQIGLLDRTAGLRSKEDSELFGSIFTTNCSTTASGTSTWSNGGLCLTAARAEAGAQSAWLRTTSAGYPVLDPCGNNKEYVYEANAGKCTGGNIQGGKRVWSNPRYIVEMMEKSSKRDSKTGSLYRITAKAWGRNKNTQVTLQSYYFVTSTSQGQFETINKK